MADAEPDMPTHRLGGLFDGREEYAPPSPGGKKAALTEGLLVVDTNVLLHLYRFGSEARDELISVLELLGDRLFVPAQVASEFVRLRLGVAMEMRQELLDNAARAGEELNQLGDQLTALGRKRGLSGTQQKKLTKTLQRAGKRVRTLLEEAAADRAWAESPSTPDPLLPALTELLEGKVGKPYAEDRAKELREEADRRSKANIPPGWKDAGKRDPVGDYLLWCQTLDEAAERQLPIYLVTDDVKDDWYLRVKGRTIGPLPELVREAKKEAGVTLYMSDVAGFLEQAREALSATVSEGTIEEATRRPLYDIGRRSAGAARSSALDHALRRYRGDEDVRAALDSLGASMGPQRSLDAVSAALKTFGASASAQSRLDAVNAALNTFGASMGAQPSVSAVNSALKNIASQNAVMHGYSRSEALQRVLQGYTNDAALQAALGGLTAEEARRQRLLAAGAVVPYDESGEHAGVMDEGDCDDVDREDDDQDEA